MYTLSASLDSAIPEINRALPVEIMRDFDTIVLFGRLAAASQTLLTLRRDPEDPLLPALEPESMVMIRCYDLEMNPILMRAKVLSSSGDECRTGELELIPYHTDRKNIRYPLCPPASAGVLGAGEEKSRPCQLLNVSMGGACIVSGSLYEVGQALRLTILSNGQGSIPLPCEVIRVAPRRGDRYEYGLAFTGEERKGCLAGFLREWLGCAEGAADE